MKKLQSLNALNMDAGTIKIDVPETLRPKVHRQLGMPLIWDKRIERIDPKALPLARRFGVSFCRLYRRIRPRAIGDRCVYEPSCSRYAELCCYHFSLFQTIKLTIARLKKCGKVDCGGIDLPPGVVWEEENGRTVQS